MKKLITLTALLSLSACITQAALLADWNDSAVITIDDLADNSTVGNNARAISSLSYVHQDGGHYFLMVLADAPGTGFENYSPAYMINIDHKAGGGSSYRTVGPPGSGASSYVAGFDGINGTIAFAGQELTGIDMIVDAHYINTGLQNTHFHTYEGDLTGDPKFDEAYLSTVGSFQTDGARLEWFIGDDYLGDDFRFAGSTLDPSNAVSYDITEFINVPEPTSMALLALGIVAFGLRRKSRA